MASLRRAMPLFAVLAMLAFFARIGHMAFVSHVLCATHGTVEHADAHDRPGHGEHADEAGGHGYENDGPAVAEDGCGDGDHAACDGIATAEILPDAAHWHTPTAILAFEIPTSSGSIDVPAARRWLLAPKTSPPAVS